MRIIIDGNSIPFFLFEACSNLQSLKTEKKKSSKLDRTLDSFDYTKAQDGRVRVSF